MKYNKPFFLTTIASTILSYDLRKLQPSKLEDGCYIQLAMQLCDNIQSIVKF